MMTKMMNNTNNKLRLLPIIGIALTIIGYLFLTFQTFTLNKRKNVLKDEIAELENIKQRLTSEVKTKDTIINIQEKIISKSSDLETVRRGEILKVQLQESVARRPATIQRENTNSELAEKYELEGFNFLLQRDVNNAILSFRKSEESHNGFNMVYAIASYLDINRDELSDKKSDLWEEVYQTILNDYSWKMPDEIKTKLTEEIKTNEKSKMLESTKPIKRNK